jgi:hypothetical protein
MESWALEITPGLLERGVAIERDLETPLLFHDSPTFIFALRLIQHDELDRARRMYEEIEEAAIAYGDEATRQWVVLQLVTLERYAGRLQRALEHATLGLELAEQTQELQYRGMMSGVKAGVEADLGQLQQARHSAEDALALSQAVSDEHFIVMHLGVLGHIEWLLGNLEVAGRYLRELPSRLLAVGQKDVGLSDIWPNAIEVLIALGELDLARVYLGQYEQLARLASRRAEACALRCRGLFAAAESDFSAAFDVL